MEDLTKFCANACAERMALEGDVQAERIIIDLIKQRDELLEALKSVSVWSESLNRIMPTWLDSEVDEAISNAEK